jgi:carboxypeptidase family protein/Big-like domain-containing protein
VRTRHVYLGAACAALVATFAACSSSDKSSGSPTSPSPTPSPSPTLSVRSVTVTAAPRTASTFQMAARAEMSDGSARDVTADAQWATSNADLATISPAGVLTVVHSGQVDVRATYQNVTGTLAMTVAAMPPPGSTLVILSGTTSETPPAAKPLANVTVRVTSGPGAGRSTVTDPQGRFGFTEFPAGELTLEAVKDGYVTWQMAGIQLDHDREIGIVMFPTPPTDNSGATATARCNDGSWSWAQTPSAACTANGGVAYGVCPGPLCTTSTR